MHKKNKPTKVPLRIGLLLDSLMQPQWVYQITADIQSSTVAEVVLIIKNDTQDKQKSLIQKIWVQRDYLLYRAYSRLDHLLFKVEHDAFKQVSIEPLISNASIIPVKPIQQKYLDYFPAEDVETILDYQLDVALRFGFRILKGRVLQIAQYGIWSYHHGDNLVNRGGPPGFWEVMERQPVTGSILQVLTEELDSGKVIYRSYASTHKRSVKRNKNNYYWKSSAFVLRKLDDLYQNGPATLNGDPYASIYSPYSHRLYKNPTNKELFPLLIKFGIRTAFSKLKELFSLKQWFLAYQLKATTTSVGDTFYRFKPIIPPQDRDWADPFPVKKDDKYFIFIEEYIYKDKKGHIAVIEMDQEEKYRQPVPVLTQPYHLSYPFIFQWQGHYYMIPETARHHTVELYRCISFPNEWQLETILLEGFKAADATLLELDGRWWMFVNIGVKGTIRSDDELYLFYAQTPLGPWQPHPHNPVKSDCRSARPGGRLFWWQGDLYRPAQDCSKNYGHAISLNKIIHLTPNQFVETEVSKILPCWFKNLVATHTLNSFGELTVIDGMLKSWKPF